MLHRLKAVGLVGAAVLALAVAGCGSNDNGSSATGTSAQTTTAASTPAWLTKADDAAQKAQEVPTEILSSSLGEFTPKPKATIYHVACNLALEGCTKIANGIKAGVNALGYEFKICNGGTTADKIGACFDNAINSKPDAIIVNGIGASDAADQYAKVAKSKIPLVGTFTGNDPGVEGVATEIAGDVCSKQAKANADIVISDSKGKANVLFVGTKTFKCNIQRQQGFLDEMKTCATCKVSTLPFAIQSQLPQQLQAALQKNPNIDYIVGTFDAIALAATDAVRQAGKADQIKVLGFDGDAPNLALVKKGEIQIADVTTGAPEDGWAAADAAARAIAGKDLPPIVSVTTLAVTKDNIGQIPGGIYTGPQGFEDQFKKLWGKG
jgi:ribose transport system substrate-binding protein